MSKIIADYYGYKQIKIPFLTKNSLAIIPKSVIILLCRAKWGASSAL